MLSKNNSTRVVLSSLVYLPGLILSILLILFISFLLYKLAFFQNPKDIFTSYSPYVIHLLKFTFFQATLSTLLSIFFGILISWSIFHFRTFPFRDTIVSLFSSALVLPSIVIVLGIISVFGKHGWLNELSTILFDKNLGNYIYGLGGILFAHVYFNASYASRVLYDAFYSIPTQRYKVAKTLGLNIWQRFYYIEFPNLKSYIFGLSSTIFLLCFSSFVIVLILGGNPSYNTLEVAIYEALKFDFDIPLSIKLSFLQIAISLVILIFISYGYSTNDTSLNNYKKISWIETKKELILHGTLITLFSFIFLMPLFSVIIDGTKADFIKLFSEKGFVNAFKTSILVAFLSSFFTLFLSLALSFSKSSLLQNNLQNKKTIYKIYEKIITLSSSVYLIVPSIVLGVGFFLLSRDISLSLHLVAFAALIFANTLLSLPFAFNAIYPRVYMIMSKYDKIVKTLGIGIFSKAFYIYMPNLKAQIIYTAALSFSFSLGDLSIIALFGDKDMATLPWYLYEKMGSYRTNDAAGIALVLLVLVLSLFMITLKANRVKDS